jgi:hypothetical protein
MPRSHLRQRSDWANVRDFAKRVQGMISALVAAGIAGGYLASPRLKEVHWQAGDRPLPAPQVSVGGESPLFVVEGWEADITASSPQSLWTALPVVTAPRGRGRRACRWLPRPARPRPEWRESVPW